MKIRLSAHYSFPFLRLFFFFFFYLGLADLSAQVGLATLAELALAALGCVKGNDVVSSLNTGNTLTHRLDNSTTLVSEDDREDSLGI